MITQVFHTPSGGNWCGKAQNSKIHGIASNAAGLRLARNPSIFSGVAEASQAAPDFITRGGKVKDCFPDASSNFPGNLFAKFFNSGPFL
jgi:hypothetical protein